MPWRNPLPTAPWQPASSRLLSWPMYRKRSYLLGWPPLQPRVFDPCKGGNIEAEENHHVRVSCCDPLWCSTQEFQLQLPCVSMCILLAEKHLQIWHLTICVAKGIEVHLSRWKDKHGPPFGCNVSHTQKDGMFHVCGIRRTYPYGKFG